MIKKEEVKLEEKDEVKAEVSEEAQEEVKEKPESKKVLKTKSGIEVGEPLDLRPKHLPLVVKLPAGASSAQKEYAKVLNAYAYENPEKWALKRDRLIKRLESLAGREIVVGDQYLSINKSKISFSFIKDDKGNEFYAGQNTVGRE